MKYPTNYENYPYELKAIVDFLMEVREKYPDAKVDCNGEITYGNGNDGTEFDYEANDRLCEIGWGIEDGTVWAFKCLVDRSGHATIYCYPHGEVKPVETITRDILTPGEVDRLYRILMRACDDRGIYDATLDQVDWDLNHIHQNEISNGKEV